ncbi:discoidin domain-containing protein [Agromyces sp. NPDC058064]|uniref:discoidin domain-containing protein n=1 Tax=Agromyces sp. NPDC058064 TaxID=3346322 RepID=UPI0036D9FF59
MKRTHPPRRSAAAVIAVCAVTVASLGALAAPVAAQAADSFEVDAGQLTLTLSDTGTVTELTSKIDGSNHTAPGRLVSLIRVMADDSAQDPTSLSYDSDSSTFTFDFAPKNIKVDVQVESKTSYATFEVTGVTAPDDVDVEAVLWGPLPTNISQSVAETAGVAYDSNFAIGIHALNNKTIGGWPLELDSLGYPGGQPNRMDYHMGAAAPTAWGSVLQAYSWDYTTARTRTIGIPGVPDQYMPDQPVPALAGSDAQLEGSKIALFGAWRPNILPVLENIQLGEGLYHGTIDGKWQKTAQATTQSFLVLSDISSSNISQAAAYATQAGMSTVYSLEGVSGPWVSDGHQVFKPKLGATDAEVKTTVDVAAELGVKYGAHTLSDFISTNDGYVRPVPHPGLAKAGSASLTRALDQTSTEIYVSDAVPFKNGHGSVVQVGDELISFRTVTTIGAGEWRLSGGSRAAYGTSAAPHAIGATASRLWANQYGGFLGGHDLVEEISSRFAAAWNNTGTRAMSFDGLEGLYNSEYGPYDLSNFMSNMLSEIEEKDGFLTEASMMSSNIWDMQSRVSWGESNTSMSQRYSNMTYMRRNFLPSMIGWLYLRNYGSVRALEYDLSKMAAWNAGTGLQSSVAALASKGEYLAKIKEWEAARNLGAFTKDQRNRMMDTSTYWTLSVVEAETKWSLQQTDKDGNPVGAPEDVFVGNTAGSMNVALNKPVTLSGKTTRSLDFVNDGDTSSSGHATSLKGRGAGWMQIDLGKPTTVNQIKLWQPYDDGRSYHDVVVQLSNDPEFGVGETVTVFNNDIDNTLGHGAGTDAEYAESSSGKSIRVDDVTARYARFWANGSTTNPHNAWVEAQIFQSPRNLASGITPTFSGEISQSPTFATDGSTETSGWVGLTAPGTGWMQLDLGGTRTINQIKLWQYWGNGRTYHDVVVQLSDDPTFETGVTTVFNNDTDNSAGLGVGTDAEYAETSVGKAIQLSSVDARYVRFWASGNTSNPYNSWVEAQVTGY